MQFFSRFGKNAFAHESGIHQDGLLKMRQTYEIIDPKEVGAGDSQIILTARSGRAALRYCAQKLDYELSRDKRDNAYERFLSIADKHNHISDQQLLNLLESI